MCARLLKRLWPRKFMSLVKGKQEFCFACYNVLANKCFGVVGGC